MFSADLLQLYAGEGVELVVLVARACLQPHASELRAYIHYPLDGL